MPPRRTRDLEEKRSIVKQEIVMKARVSIVAASSIAASESASPDYSDLAAPRVQEVLEHHSKQRQYAAASRELRRRVNFFCSVNSQ